MQRDRVESIKTQVAVCGSRPPMGRRHGHSGHSVKDLQDKRKPKKELRYFSEIRETQGHSGTTTANVAE